MKKWVFILMMALLVLSACSSKDSDADAGHGAASMTEVKVEFLTPEKNPNAEQMLLQVKVTQGDEVVTDASSVQFEVWPSGERKTKAQMVTAEHTADGIYEAEVPLKNDQVYYAYAHTEARGLHVMPKKKFIIGNPDMSKVKKEI